MDKTKELKTALADLRLPPKDTVEYLDEHLLDLWQKGYDFEDIKKETMMQAILLKNKYARQNTIDIIQGKYDDMDDMQKRMPMCPIEKNGRRYLTNIPSAYLKWAVLLGRLTVRI